jgi:hypothetical protein
MLRALALVILATLTVGAAHEPPPADRLTLGPASGVKTLCWRDADASTAPNTCVPLDAIKQAFDGFADGRLATLEQTQLAERQARVEVMTARAARADCEAMLGPLEAQARRLEHTQALAALRAQYERWHPQWSLDASGAPVRVPIRSTPKPEEVR